MYIFIRSGLDDALQYVEATLVLRMQIPDPIIEFLICGDLMILGVLKLSLESLCSNLST